MSNTHGDILHGPISVFPSEKPDIQFVGWVCPVCGRSLSPMVAYCPCKTTAGIPPSFTNKEGKTTYIASGKKLYETFEFEF